MKLAHSSVFMTPVKCLSSGPSLRGQGSASVFICWSDFSQRRILWKPPTVADNHKKQGHSHETTDESDKEWVSTYGSERMSIRTLWLVVEREESRAWKGAPVDKRRVLQGYGSVMQQQADEDELGLSSAALAALKEFALENDLLGPEAGDGEAADLRLRVQEQMDVKERAHDFRFTFGDDGDDEQVSIALTGVNPELGQTLASTGLTVWRAAEEMARFMWDHRKWFAGKRVVELGAGLGLCGVLASKLCTGGTVVITDGGEEFTDSAMDAVRKNLDKNSCKLVVPDSPATDGSGAAGAAAGGGTASVILERLTWGEHADFLVRYGGGGDDAAEDSAGGGGRRGGFDYILAADVIYEEEGVSPLLRTVVDILRLRQGKQEPERGRGHEQQKQRQIEPAGGRSTFLLAFARRNISIERVLTEAESLGLAWRVPEDFVPATVSENIYLMSLVR